MAEKPINRKNYGSIPHLPNSRTGPADKSCHEGQAQIATKRARDRHDEVFVQEKLDGSNVGVARVGDELYPIGRAGWLAASSPYEQHQIFADWVYQNHEQFLDVLRNGERLVGEWLAQAHGTRYELRHDPFVAFDLMVDDRRLPYNQFADRVADLFTIPALIHHGDPISVAEAMKQLGTYGYHGALDPVEGCVWRIERDRLVDCHSGQRERAVDFLVKFVRHDKLDGCYLPKESGANPIWNWRPTD